MSRRLALLASLLTVPSLACGPTEAARGPWTTSVDTLNAGAGPIVVVNTPPPELGDEDVSWRFEQVYRIGGAMETEGPFSFARIAQIAVDSGGRLGLLDGEQLRIFGPDGGHLRTLGGKGAGPGELDGAFGVIAYHDDLLVAESRNGRLSVFRADSGFVTSYLTRFYSRGLVGWDAFIDSAGRVAVLSSGALPGGTGQQMVRTYDRSMAPLDSIGYRPYEDQPDGYSWKVPFGNGMSYIYVPLLGWPGEVLDGGGRIWRPDESGDYLLKQFLPPGDTIRVVEVRRPRIPVSAAERDSVIEDLRGKLAGEGMETELDWSLIPELHPAIQEISQSEEGDLWVRMSPVNAAPTLYDVLDGEGRYRGTASIPGRVKRGVEPVVRGDRVWAVVLGDLDVESVVHGRLIPSRTTTGAN